MACTDSGYVRFTTAVAYACGSIHIIPCRSGRFRGCHQPAGNCVGDLSCEKHLGKGQTDFITERFSRYNVPVLSDIPFIGDLFFKSVYNTSYFAIAVAILAWFVIFKTPFGLRLRAVGEHPMAADTMGINVTKMRYIAVMISGALAGIGGAIYAQTISGDFGHATINGQGFMALAA